MKHSKLSCYEHNKNSIESVHILFYVNQGEAKYNLVT